MVFRYYGCFEKNSIFRNLLFTYRWVAFVASWTVNDHVSFFFGKILENAWKKTFMIESIFSQTAMFERWTFRSSHRRCSVKTMFLKILQNSEENTFARVCNFIKKDTLAQVFSREFCEIFKNTFFIEHLQATASDLLQTW